MRNDVLRVLDKLNLHIDGAQARGTQAAANQKLVSQSIFCVYRMPPSDARHSLEVIDSEPP